MIGERDRPSQSRDGLRIGPAPYVPVGRTPQVSDCAPVIARLLEVPRQGSRNHRGVLAPGPFEPFGESLVKTQTAAGRHALDQGLRGQTVDEVVADDSRPGGPDEPPRGGHELPLPRQHLAAVTDQPGVVATIDDLRWQAK